MNRLLSVCLCIIGFSDIFAGGIVTNTNQSASWARNPSTAATTGIEAAYYNPAGTIKLGNGLHFSLNNQSVFQNREIENNYSNLNEHLYKGGVTAPILPSLYAVYKLNKFAFSFNFNPIGGGGSAEFKHGLPSFEISASDLVQTFASSGATAYQLDGYLKGTSIYWGYQVGVSYKLSDVISVYGGLRFVMADNTYEGYIRNIQLNMGGTWMSASTVLAGASSQAGSAASGLNALVSAAPTITLAQAQGAGYLPAASRTALEQGLLKMGLTQAQVDAMSVTAVQGAFTQQSVKASIGSKLVRNQKADTEQTGSGICPIIGVNISPNDKLNIGLKYEFATKMEVKNKTSYDFVTDSLPGQPATTMFPNGAQTPADMPALLTVGVSYKLISKLKVSGSLFYYFDKDVKYGKKMDDGFVKNNELMNHNFYEIALGIEYNLTDKLLLSTGFLRGVTGVKPEYNSDISYSCSSKTFGLGGKYTLNSKFGIDMGIAYSSYEKQERTTAFSESYPSALAKETYTKNTMVYAIGLEINL